MQVISRRVGLMGYCHRRVHAKYDLPHTQPNSKSSRSWRRILL